VREQVAHIRDDNLRGQRRVTQKRSHTRSIQQTHELPLSKS
jgi:hypothetical protein